MCSGTIPRLERPGFIGQIRQRLADDGFLFASTPFPSATRRKRELADPGLQIIDEEVELPAVVSEASAAGFQLIGFRAYDVWTGSPEYQAMVFSPARSFGGPPALRSARLGRIEARNRHATVRRARRLALATRCVSRGQIKTAVWFLRGHIKNVRS